MKRNWSLNICWLNEMKLFVIGHTGIAIGLAVIPLLVVLALVWRCGRSARIIAAVLGFAWAVVASAYFASIIFRKRGEPLRIKIVEFRESFTGIGTGN